MLNAFVPALTARVTSLPVFKPAGINNLRFISVPRIFIGVSIVTLSEVPTVLLKELGVSK